MVRAAQVPAVREGPDVGHLRGLYCRAILAAKTGVDCQLARARLRADLLELGAPVPFDIYNAGGRLLLSRGHLIESELQLERLIAIGLYDPASADAQRLSAARRSGPVVGEFDRLPSSLLRNKVSIFERLSEVALRLDGLLCLDAPAAEFASAIRAQVASIQECCALDSDAALAHILVSESVRYSSRHPGNVAILVTHLLSRLQHDEARAASAAAAALTMNLGMGQLQDSLHRQQEPLTSEQREAVRLHPNASAQALRRHGVDDPVWLQAVEQHHEARDGSGYPAGLKDEAICREAQVVAHRLGIEFRVPIEQRIAGAEKILLQASQPWESGLVEAPEIIRDGEFGFLVNSVAEGARSVGRLGDIDRASCRRLAEERFSRRVACDAYLALYAKLTARADRAGRT